MKKFVSDLLAHDLRAKGPSPVRLKEDGLRFETKVLTLKARRGVDVPTVLSQFISTLLTVNGLPHARALWGMPSPYGYDRMWWLTVQAGVGERRRADAM